MFLFGVFLNTFVYEILQRCNLIWLFDFKVTMRLKFQLKNVFSTDGYDTVTLWVLCANNCHLHSMRCTWTHRDIPVCIQNNVEFKTCTWLHHDVPLRVWRSADSFIKWLSVQTVSAESLTESLILHLISVVTHLLITVTTVDNRWANTQLKRVEYPSTKHQYPYLWWRKNLTG